MLKQSSTAFQDAAKAVSSLILTVTETEQRKNPFAGAIIAALEQNTFLRIRYWTVF